jgi:hypothetical protein
MDAEGEGACEALLGYAWNGLDCAGLSGCDCAGQDCDILFESAEECASWHFDC